MPEQTVSHVFILKDDRPPLKSTNTALVAAATVCGIPLSDSGPFAHTIEEDEQSGRPKHQTVWSLKDTEIEFLPAFEPERISTAEFVRRWKDPQWRIDNPHHPIAHMVWQHETENRLREKIRENKPLIMIRRGRRIAFIPQGCDAAKREKILALL